ncbi:MCE family protein [Aeromicrobium marinum]|nr:MlaD family protein [Aeromicrobium marinum]
MQLIAFLVITLVGASYVGGRYAQVDRFFVDRSFPVTVDLTDSGGIFAGAEVTYRGIAVGRVGELEFTDAGVRATLEIEDSAPDIPSDLVAVVANKSAIGEQYIDLQPRDNEEPYLAAGDNIGVADSRVPIDTTTLLVDLQDLVSSVDPGDLNTVVDELGQAFEGTAPDLTAILDTSSRFIADAEANIDVTRQLLRDSSTVLATQIDKGSQIQAFSRDLALLSDTLVGSDADLRELLDEGGDAAAITDVVVAENSADLSAIFGDLVGPTRIANQNLAGLQSIFILYPYLVQGAFTATVPTGDGEFNAAFGNVVQFDAPVCELDDGVYRDLRNPRDITDVELRTDLGCPADSPLVRRNSLKTELSRAPVAADSDRKDHLEWLLIGPTR